jgi:hypothetical protein
LLLEIPYFTSETKEINMAMKKPNRSAQSSGVPSSAQPANEGVGAKGKQRPELDQIAIPPFEKFCEYTDIRKNLVIEFSDSFTLDEIQALMTNVQLAQRNLTEGLNHLKAYRKEVSTILEKRRREAAQARKQAAQSNQQPGKAPINVSDSSLQ